MTYNAGAIANAYDLAPQLIGNTASTTYDNMDQAKAASYTEGIFPVNDRIYALWNKWLLPMYPDLKKAYLYYDKESIEVLQAIIQAKNSAKIDQATKIFLAGGCDLFTYQEMVGDLVGVKPDNNGKGIYRVNTILVSSDKLKDYADQAMTLPAAPPKPIPEPVSDNLPPAPGTNNQQQQGNTNNATGGTTPPATDSNTGSTNKPNKPARANPANTPAGQTSGQAGGGKASTLPLTARAASHHESHLATNGARLEQNALSGKVKAFGLKTQAARDAYAKEMEAARDTWTEQAQEQLTTYFKAEHKAVSGALNGTSTRKSALKAAVEGQAAKLKKTLARLWQDVEEDIGAQVAQSFTEAMTRTKRPISLRLQW